MKRQPTELKTIFVTYPIMGWYPKYGKNSCNWTEKHILIKSTLFPQRHRDDQQAHEKVCSITSHYRKATKTLMKYLFVPVRMVIERTRNNKCSWGCGAQGTHVDSWQKYRCHHCGKHMEVPPKPKWTIIGSSNSGYSSEVYETLILKEIYIYIHLYVHWSTVYNSQDWNPPKCGSIDGWRKKMRHVNTQQNTPQP